MVNGRTVNASATLASPPIFKGPTYPSITLSSFLSQNDMTIELRNDLKKKKSNTNYLIKEVQMTL